MDSLAQHQKIAFDFDGTLIDGGASPIIGAYIKQNPTKAYFIITFRTPEQTKTIPHELVDVGLSIDLFTKVIPMPSRLSMAFDIAQQFRRNAGLPSLNMTPEILLPDELKIMYWKGFAASRVGATVLVDDMPTLARLGCEKFNVILIDAAQIQ